MPASGQSISALSSGGQHQNLQRKLTGLIGLHGPKLSTMEPLCHTQVYAHDKFVDDSRFAKEAGVLAESAEVGSPLRLGPPASAREAKGHEVLHSSKVWEPRPSGPANAPVTQSFLCSPPSYAVSGLDTPARQPSLSRQGSIVSCTSSPRISMPVGQESSKSGTKATVDWWESSRSKEGGSQRSSWVEELIEEERLQEAVALKRKLSSDSTCTGKSFRISHPNPKHHNRAAVPKKEIATSMKVVCMSESLSENEDISDDEGEGGTAVSEKRRKRMLSNRASAQRSRQRRQERLDTLEVLVAQLRVENSSLTRKVCTAAVSAKKLEYENMVLRDRLFQQALILSTSSNLSDMSEKTSEDSGLVDEGKDGSVWRVATQKTEATKNESSEETWEALCPEYALETEHGRNLQRSCAPSDGDDELVKLPQQQPQWDNNCNSGSNFNFEFRSDRLGYSGAGTDQKTLSRTQTPNIMLHQIPQEYGGMHIKDLYLSAAMNQPSFQGLDPFGIDIEQGEQEMDKNLDSRSVEDIWLDGLANCLK